MTKPRMTKHGGRGVSAPEPTEHANGGTNRPETPDLEGRTPLPAELTGRASARDDDLAALFDSDSAEHVTDGFRGASGDDPDDDLSGANARRVDRERPRD